ncbi:MULTISPECIES: hypothetical protein [unclassified Luteimonas]|uniref:hypothetical protein n=1 Tax=unclassified Luteimonas TaxID=2629088 RepID=UPI0018F0A41C|nr:MULTISPECIES: hypothetical protein [unclassified Luteimonas]MBJ6982985.1 hypothetical protein [Luteimonas sp. MC1572]MBJ7574411.1 hypothetical protein [Luteimonas sp. MC1828]QQO04200.1 hypothetical protein JGR64_05485 [Luteimonas sp. MC1572]
MAWANENKLDVASAKPFVEQRARIEADLARGEIYSELSAANATRVKASLDVISSQLETAGTVASLSEESRREVASAQQLVNTLLQDAEADSRVVCKRELKTGSRMPTTQCSTAGQQRRQRESLLKPAQHANQ